MIVRTTDEITGTDRDVSDGTWRSKRIVLAGDNVGFSFHETTIQSDSVNVFRYEHHIEAVWVVEGTGTLTDLETGEQYPLKPGTMYLLDGHERHRVACDEQLRMLCVFNPPVTGREVHDESGAYPPPTEELMTEILQRIEDNYPTRLDHAIAPIPRIEPTVWGRPGDGPLTDKALDSFSAAGYLIRQNAVPEDWLPPLRNELERIGAELASDDPRVIREPKGSIRTVFEPHVISDLIADVINLDTVLPIARQLLGGDVYIHQARINLMPGFTGNGFYWHSDFETWHAEDGMPSPRAVSCSIALTKNYPYNGSLMVMPGTHETFYPCVGVTPDNNHNTSLVSQDIGVPDQSTLTKAADHHGIDQFTGPAGTALWFDSNLLHGSGSNITPFPRSNVFLVFNSIENTLVEPFAARTRRPEYLAARDPKPLRQLPTG